MSYTTQTIRYQPLGADGQPAVPNAVTATVGLVRGEKTAVALAADESGVWTGTYTPEDAGRYVAEVHADFGPVTAQPGGLHERSVFAFDVPA